MSTNLVTLIECIKRYLRHDPLQPSELSIAWLLGSPRSAILRRLPHESACIPLLAQGTSTSQVGLSNRVECYVGGERLGNVSIAQRRRNNGKKWDTGGSGVGGRSVYFPASSHLLQAAKSDPSNWRAITIFWAFLVPSATIACLVVLNACCTS